MRSIELQLFAESGGEKTEDPTPRRRRKARREGQVFQSKELTQALLLVMLFAILWFTVPAMGRNLQLSLAEALTWKPDGDWSVSRVHAMIFGRLGQALVYLAPLLMGTLVVGAGAGVLQTGFVFSAKPLSPDLGRMDPVSGLKRIFSLRSAANLAKSLLKVVALAAVSYRVIATNFDGFPSLLTRPIPQSIHWTAMLLRTLIIQCCLVLAGVAVVDFWYERYEYERQLRMTKKEVQDELKDTEGDPQLRGRIKNLQSRLARARMMSDAAKSDVVITNPTEYAVALRYDFESMNAPLVVAKGRGLVAKRIREIAKENGVVIQRKPSLARALYDGGEIGEYVPEDLYRAVAEVLAFVWKTQGRRLGADIR